MIKLRDKVKDTITGLKRLAIANIIYLNLYGTDTMAYLSSWLSICFFKISIPIILAGQVGEI